MVCCWPAKFVAQNQGVHFFSSGDGRWLTKEITETMGVAYLRRVSETPTPTTCLKSPAIHLQFVRQYAPHLYRRTFLLSKLRRKGNPAVRLPFVLQYASHLCGSTPPICTAVLLEKYWGWGHRNVSEYLQNRKLSRGGKP